MILASMVGMHLEIDFSGFILFIGIVAFVAGDKDET